MWHQHAKVADLIKMPFGMVTRLDPRNHMLKGPSHLMGMGGLEGTFWSIQKVCDQWIGVLCKSGRMFTVLSRKFIVRLKLALARNLLKCNSEFYFSIQTVAIRCRHSRTGLTLFQKLVSDIA